MGILKDFFTGAGLTNEGREAFQERLRSIKHYKVVCKYCGRESTGRDVRICIESVQGCPSGCGRGNHEPMIFED